MNPEPPTGLPAPGPAAPHSVWRRPLAPVPLATRTYALLVALVVAAVCAGVYFCNQWQHGYRPRHGLCAKRLSARRDDGRKF